MKIKLYLLFQFHNSGVSTISIIFCIISNIENTSKWKERRERREREKRGEGNYSIYTLFVTSSAISNVRPRSFLSMHVEITIMPMSFCCSQLNGETNLSCNLSWQEERRELTAIIIL
jgi:hypothetical protein